MTVRLEHDGRIALVGSCPIEDAEPLLRHLLAHPGATVDWRACEEAHAAVVQVLLVSAPPLQGPPSGAFLSAWVAPLLAQNERHRAVPISTDLE